MGIGLEHQLSGKVCLKDLGSHNIILGASEEVAIEDNQVGVFARFKRTGHVVQKQDFGAVDRIKAYGLRPRERLLGVKLPLVPPRAAGDGGGDAQERVVRIVGAKRANLLHMVRTPAGDPSGLNDAAEWLKISQPF